MTSDPDSESPPTIKFYSITGIRNAIFLGLLPGAVLISRNYSRLGNGRAAFISILLGTLGYVLLFVVFTVFTVPEEYDWALFPSYLVLVFVISAIAKRLQGEALSLHEQKGGQFYGLWRVYGISLLIFHVAFFVTYVGIIMLDPSLLPQTSDIQIRISSREVVKVGEPFEIHVYIRNDAADQQTLMDIDFADEYLQEIVIESSDPPFSNLESWIPGGVSYRYDLPIPPRQEIRITFVAHGKIPGKYASHSEVCVNSRAACLGFFVRTIVE